jgi:L-ascorbate metabolism protein UlaG (beta-lactamase superfamily)
MADATLWAGFVIQHESSTVYFAGDTAWGPHFERIRARFGSPRLAILPIGAFEPSWFMKPIHLSPEEALAAHDVLAPQASVAMHFGTFRLGDDGQREAPERLRATIVKAGRSEPPFWVLEFGEGRDEPHRPLEEPQAPPPAPPGAAAEPPDGG